VEELKKTPVCMLTEKTWDLIVVGGGFTGIAAAITAKRQGLQNVLILEKAGYLGGACATMLINPFMPYWTMVDGKYFNLSRGFFTELREVLREVGGLGTEAKRTNDTLHEEFIKIALDRFVNREGVQPLFHATLAGVEKDGERITAVHVVTKAGVLRFTGRYFVDSTGDADLAAMSGCPYHLGRTDGLCQPMTLCFRIGNIRIPEFIKRIPEMQEKYKELQKAGKIKNLREDVLVFSTQVDGMVHFNTTRVVMHNPTDPLDVTNAEMEAREQMLEMYNFLREYAAGCEECQLLYSASEIGVRESRMIEGEYVLTEYDLRDCIQFEDRIAAGNYDIDIHNPEGSGTSHYYFPAGKWYTIPFRSLIPKNASNLLVAGRCISSTHEAQASYRIMPIVTTLGEAAGMGIAVAAQSDVSVREADVKEIQKRLTDAGAFIG